MTEKGLYEAEGVLETIRAVIHITIEFNKALITVGIGAGIVALPYVLLIGYLVDAVGAWGGKGLAVVALGVFLLATMVPVTLLVIVTTMTVEAWLPWDAFDQ